MYHFGFPGDAVVKKKSSANVQDVGSIPGSVRSFAGGSGNPLQHSCQDNPRDRGAWWATVHGVAKSWTQLSMHTHFSKVSWWQGRLCICEHRKHTGKFLYLKINFAVNLNYSKEKSIKKIRSSACTALIPFRKYHESSYEQPWTFTYIHQGRWDYTVKRSQ